MSNLKSCSAVLIDEKWDDFDFRATEDETLEEEPKTFSCIAKEDDLLQMYLKDIGKTKLLSSKDELFLGKNIKRELHKTH